MIPTLNYKYVSLIFCDAWDDSKECKLSFGTNLNNFYHSIDGYQCKSILIT